MTESIQGMENKNRMVMWMTLSALLVLALVQNVDVAPVENRPFEKYMRDLYKVLFDEDGQPRKGVATMDDNVRCFLPGEPEVSSSNSKMSLTFDIREIKKDEQVIKAYLIDPKVRSTSARAPASSSPIDADDDSPPSLLDLVGGGWKSTDVTSKVKTWHKGRHKENAIHVDRKGYEDYIFSRNLDKILQAPFLVVHSRSNSKHAKRSEHEGENETVNLSKPDQSFYYTRSSDTHSCRREDFEINTSKIGWERSILERANIKVYRCEGKCEPGFDKSNNATTNARLRALFALVRSTQDGKPIGYPCCAPVDFTPVKLLSIRKVEGKHVTEIKTFSDLRVKSCGCV